MFDNGFSEHLNVKSAKEQAMAGMKEGMNSAIKDALKGCYGSHIHPSQVKEWLMDNIMDNINRKDKIALDIWSCPGCVFKDTMITVKKISNANGHKIWIKEGGE